MQEYKHNENALWLFPGMKTILNLIFSIVCVPTAAISGRLRSIPWEAELRWLHLGLHVELRHDFCFPQEERADLGQDLEWLLWWIDLYSRRLAQWRLFAIAATRLPVNESYSTELKRWPTKQRIPYYDTVQSSLLFSCCRHSAHAPERDCHISTAKTKCPPNVLTFSLHLAVSLWTSFQIKAATVKRDSFYFTAHWCKFYEVFIKEFDMDQTTKPTTAQSQLPFLIYLCKVDEIFGRVTSFIEVESKQLHCPINWCVLISSLSRFTSFRHHMKIFVNNFCFRNQTKTGETKEPTKTFSSS